MPQGPEPHRGRDLLPWRRPAAAARVGAATPAARRRGHGERNTRTAVGPPGSPSPRWSAPDSPSQRVSFAPASPRTGEGGGDRREMRCNTGWCPAGGRGRRTAGRAATGPGRQGPRARAGRRRGTRRRRTGVIHRQRVPGSGLPRRCAHQHRQDRVRQVAVGVRPAGAVVEPGHADGRTRRDRHADRLAGLDGGQQRQQCGHQRRRWMDVMTTITQPRTSNRTVLRLFASPPYPLPNGRVCELSYVGAVTGVRHLLPVEHTRTAAASSSWPRTPPTNGGGATSPASGAADRHDPPARTSRTLPAIRATSMP